MHASSLVLAGIFVTYAWAQAAAPQIEVIDSNLVFVTGDNNHRVGYQLGNRPAVMFDELARNDQQLSSAVLNAYTSGKDVGTLSAGVQCAQNLANNNAALANYPTKDDMRILLNTQISVEAAVRAGADTTLTTQQNASASTIVGLQSRVQQLEGSVAALQAAVTAAAAASNKGVVPPPQWTVMQVDAGGSVRPSYAPNSGFHAVRIYGAGFAQLYHDLFVGGKVAGSPDYGYADFTCIFTDNATGVQARTDGTMTVLDQSLFHIECPAPAATATTVFRVSVRNATAVLPFTGLPGRDFVYVDMFWGGVISNLPAGLLLSGVGFPVSGSSYLVTAGSFNSTASVVNGNLQCAKAYTGPEIINGVAALPVTVQMLVSGVPTRQIGFNPFAFKPAAFNISACFNGIKDGTETDVDCGGSACWVKCGEAKKCNVNSDCATIACSFTAKTCLGGDGLTVSTPAQTCKSLKRDFPNYANGVYWINGLGGVFNSGIPVYCWMDAQRGGGGWTLVLKNYYDGTFDSTYDAGLYRCTSNNEGNCRAYCGDQAMGDVNVAPNQLMGQRYKLSDAQINLGIIGASKRFDYMMDQTGFNSYYSTGNFEYIIVQNYTATFAFDVLTDPSSTPTTMKSFRIADNANIWTGNLICGLAGGAHPNGKGINCYNVNGLNPAGGAGCSPGMGKYVDVGWHHLYMFEHNSDSYAYMCNGAQHSSSYSINHRWWFRDTTVF